MSAKNLEACIREHGNSLRDVTLCYLVKKNPDKVLIAMKKRGFGSGKYNGVGGKLEKGETVEDALVRETYEEIGVKLKHYRKVAKIDFYFSGSNPNPDNNQRAHVFLSNEWDGIPSESEEMRPEWVEFEKLPLDKMWADDKYWLPYVLNGKNVEAAFVFGDGNKIDDMKINYKRSNDI